jgi:hypothetical protein
LDFKSRLINILKGGAFKLLVKKLFGSAVFAGPKAWLLKFVYDYLFDEFAEPLIKYSFRRMGYVYNVQRGKILVKKMRGATGDEWRDLAGRV